MREGAGLIAIFVLISAQVKYTKKEVIKPLLLFLINASMAAAIARKYVLKEP